MTFEMDQTAEVRARLDALIRARGDDYASLSRMLGRNPAYIQQFIKRGHPRKLDEEDRRTLARFFEVPEEELGGPPAEPDAPFATITRYDIGASAGHGALNDRELASAPLSFSSSWLRRVASGSIDALSVIRVSGDSMLPTLSSGDDILVDTADATDRLRDGIYVLRRGEELMVKRLGVNPGDRRISINSDNPAYPPVTDCDPRSIRIIGRVVWVGRRL